MGRPASLQCRSRGANPGPHRGRLVAKNSSDYVGSARTHPFVADRAKGSYHYEGGPAVCEVRSIANGEDPRAALFAEVERQLNTPFARAERFNPFRFFAALAGDSFFLGLVYFHAAADAESVVLLLRELVQACCGGSAAVFGTALDLYPNSRARLLSRHPKVFVRGYWACHCRFALCGTPAALPVATPET